MIGFLRGTIHSTDQHCIYLLVEGVGYELHVPDPVLASAIVGQTAEFYIHTNVREDDISLFAFPSLLMKSVFRRMIAISGVGPKIALSILSALSLDELFDCVKLRDVRSFQRVPGIGAKKAEKLLLELEGKLDLTGARSVETAVPTGFSSERDLTQALYQLGYKPYEVSTAMTRLSSLFGSELSTKSVSELLPLALQWLSKNVVEGRSSWRA